MSSIDLNELKNKIESFNQIYHKEILNVLVEENRDHISENSNGVFINLTKVSKNTIENVNNMVNHIIEQENNMKNRISEKNMMQKDFFKDNKEKNVITINEQ